MLHGAAGLASSSTGPIFTAAAAGPEFRNLWQGLLLATCAKHGDGLAGATCDNPALHSDDTSDRGLNDNCHQDHADAAAAVHCAVHKYLQPFADAGIPAHLM
jgi:hypothetical protein